MKKLFSKTIAILIAATLLLAGCGNSGSASQENAASSEKLPDNESISSNSTGVEGTTLYWNIGVDSKTYDPALNATLDGSNVINNTFEGLMRNKNDGNGLVPAMAAEDPEIVDNPDGSQTYTFKLRDTKWSDGKPVTAEDFVYSWRRVVNPETASEVAFLMSVVQNADEIMEGKLPIEELGVAALDEKTFQVSLKYPAPYFSELTSSTFLMPVREDVVDPDGIWAKDPEKAISNGPFVLEKYSMGNEVILKKNPNYWNAENVKLEKIVGKMIVDASTTMSAFRGGEIDITDKLVTEEIPQLIASGECTIIPALGNAFYLINQKTQIEALQDQRVRKAMQISIDRQSILKSLANNGQRFLGGYLPYGFVEPDGQDYREKTGHFYIQETADIEGAKKLLEEAGYPNGEGIPQIEILYNTNEGNKALAEVIQAMWAEIGLNVVLNNQEWAVYQDTCSQAKYPAVSVRSLFSDYADPQELMDVYKTGSTQSNNAYSNPAYDSALAKATVASGQERFDLFREAEQILIEDAYMIPLYSAAKGIIANPKVENWSMNSAGVFWFGDIQIVESI